MLEAARKKHPASRVFEKYDDMLNSIEIDAVIIGTPAHLHAEFASKALARNIHVLSEIPTVWSVAEANQLWKAHLKSKALYMTGANANFKACIDAAVDLQKRGLFGKTIYAEASYIHDVRRYFKITPWRATIEPIHYCTHSLGPVLRLMDEDLEWVSCFDTGSHINKAKGQHDVMSALFRTKSNVVVRLLTSFINNYVGAHHAYKFFTTEGCFETVSGYSKEQKVALFYSQKLDKLNKTWMQLPVDLYMPPAYASNEKAKAGHNGVDYAMLDAFFKAIRSGGPSPISLKEGLRMTLPGIYAAESARRGGELVKIKYPWKKEERKES
jgi:predicted dehydrogenase